MQSATSTLADGVNAMGVRFDIPIDSKAMRKIDADMSLFCMMEVVENGAAIMDVWHDSRMLFLLP